MKRILNILLVVFIVSVSFWTGYSASSVKEKEIYKQLDIFAEALAIIEKKYVESKNPKDLIYGALKGMLSSLDVYSEFLTPEAYSDLKIETEGKFGGIGIEITIKEGLLTVVSPIVDTPAWRAGVKAGDIIVKIDGQLTKGLTLNEAVKKLRGEPGTKVTITVLRETEREPKDITITRDIISIKDIKKALILEDKIGYIKIAEFRDNTPKDLAAALEKLQQEGLRALILDVRNNPGGLLDSAIEVSNLFLEDNKIIVSMKTKDNKEYVYKSKKSQLKFLNIPIVVLLNKGSASGSEILATALRENNRAILLGEQTFGKGSVQTVIPLSDGSAMRLTTAKYYTPSGTSIHEKGVMPDIVVPYIEVKETKEEVIFDEIEKKDFDYKKDNQIVRAIDLLKGLMVLVPK